MTDLSRAIWKKASKSASGNDACVEVAANLGGLTAVRDSKSPALGAHVVDRKAFAGFLHDVKSGRFDL